MIDFIVDLNMPIATVERDTFRVFLRDVVQMDDLPSRAELRDEIVRRAERAREGVSPLSEGSEYVSLMIDGAAGAHRTWLGVCLATYRRFYIWRLTALPDQKAATICQCLIGIIADLQNRGFTVVAVVTDNASNEVKAIKDLSSDDLVNPALPKTPFIFRVPCMSHTLNLVIVDFIKDVFKGHNIYADITKIRSALSAEAQLRLPGPCPTRWTSLNTFIRSLLTHWAPINALVRTHSKAKRVTKAVECLNRYLWSELEPCLAIIDEFVIWAGAQSAHMTGAWARVIDAVAKLQHLGDTGNHYGADFAAKLMERMTGTANLSLLILSHLVTCKGVYWYQALPDTGLGGPLSSKESVRGLIAPLLEHFREFLGADRRVWSDTWNAHITTQWFPEGDNYWSFRRGAALPKTADAPLRPWSHIATMAAILMHLPCSEAAVERLFSLMRLVLGTRRQAMQEDLLEARVFLMIRGRADANSLCNALDERMTQFDFTLDDIFGLRLP
jgi:hypothetical protein